MTFPTKRLIASLTTVAIAMSPIQATADESHDNSQTQPTVTKDLAFDSTSMIRNPGMGWLMYVENFGYPLPDPDEYWASVDPYSTYASGLYLRVPWSKMEPTEGHYAWEDPNNTITRLVEGAKKRGLKVTFRVFVDSASCKHQATPQWLFDDGAKGYPGGPKKAFTNPVITDKVFREKFENFLMAFGKQYDDPNVVDFVDMNTIGAWGEMHSVPDLKDSFDDTVSWLEKAYSAAFKKIMLVMNYAWHPFGWKAVDKAIDDGFAMRRDGVGSIKWFKDEEKEKIRNNFPRSIFVAENCYQAFKLWDRSCDEGFKPLDKMTARVVSQALDLHANYLDLRKASDVKTWNEDFPDQVKKFASLGGYRLAPVTATFPMNATADVAPKISVTWENGGVGRLPNKINNWKDRFAINYALLDSSGKVAARTSSTVDPGFILKGEPKVDVVNLNTKVKAGTYTLATAIVDSDNANTPGIRLAVKGTDFTAKPGWTKLGTITVHDDDQQSNQSDSSTSTKTQSDNDNSGSSSIGGALSSITALIIGLFDAIAKLIAGMFSVKKIN